MLISEAVVAIVAVALLLPVEVLPPLTSFVAPVVAVTVDAPAAVGVPVTGHEILAPAATVAGGVGVHAPTVTPAGRPAIAHDALIALAVAAALFVHFSVPL